MNAATSKSSTSTKKARKTSPVNGNLLPNTEGPALRFVALDVIDAHAQVRTEFDDESIAELAEDLKARGMLQPVLLRPGEEGRFVIIAGERRVRAARVAGLPAVPAIVGDTSDEQAENMQLAENIQREELSLADTARAIRKLYDRDGKIDAVAAIVKKSKSWVSKHLTVTCPEFSWRAKQLLEGGFTEDLEVLNTLSAVEKISFGAAHDLFTDIKEGRAGRKEARAVLAKVKKAAEERDAEIAEEKKEAKKQPKKAPEPPPFNAGSALWKVTDALMDTERKMIAELIAEYTEEQQVAMLETLKDDHQAGCLVAHMEPIDKMRRMANMEARDGIDTTGIAAFIIGAFNLEWTLANLLAEMERAYHS